MAAAVVVVVRVETAELLRLVVHWAPVSWSLPESTEPAVHLLPKRFVRLTVDPSALSCWLVSWKDVDLASSGGVAAANGSVHWTRI